MNISEGRDTAVLDALASACGADLLDLHRDPDHHRSVFTLVGEEAPRRLAVEAVRLLDLRTHDGVHPRIGVVDVVPFVPLEHSSMADALAARDRFARWLADELAVPSFLYGPERTLPEVRRDAWRSLTPDVGPAVPHPSAGAACVGAREVLVAYNVWLAEPDLALAKRVAAAVRRPGLRTLGLQVGARVQVSMNLIEPTLIGPADAYDLVASLAPVGGAELVGLIPETVLHAIDPGRWHDLDLSGDATIEARRGAAGR